MFDVAMSRVQEDFIGLGQVEQFEALTGLLRGGRTRYGGTASRLHS